MSKSSGEKDATQLVISEAHLNALTQRAQHGDAIAMNVLREELAEHVRADWEETFTLAVDTVRNMMLEAAFTDNLLLRETWERKAKAWQRDLEGANPTPLERILCERVATCWLEQQVIDASYHARLRGTGLSFAQSSHFQRRQDRAHKRYLTACLALVRARRLLRPQLQQVNIIAPSAMPAAPALPPAEVVSDVPPRRSGLIDSVLCRLADEG